MRFALILAAAAALAAPPPTLVRYELVESTRSLTPTGSREQALKGTVVTAGGKARWDMPGARLPGVTARAALFDGASLFLLDPDESTVSPLSREEFDELFQAPPGPRDGPPAATKDLVVWVERDGDGPPLGGTPTARWTVGCTYTLVAAQPGRLVRVRHETRGTVETLEEGGLAPTPFDDLLRLVRVRGEAREALGRELQKVSGLPVRVRFEASAEALAEASGPGGGAPASPVRSTSTTTRTVSILERRPLGKDDAALFTVPDAYRPRPLSQLKTEGAPPR
ncbi:MAG TPA: hypothetical protein PLB02_12705 [Thermoanaerobaculia bacterium]|nr:hypothetical protein [Thermoanaerobaculia bacterium]HQR68241.1 hypothetical protein [Thermoanaerobaculia bacterium]